jgi:hypothetical protein
LDDRSLNSATEFLAMHGIYGGCDDARDGWKWMAAIHRIYMYP